MHEVSIVMSIIDIARQQAEKASASAIEEIELDIGSLSGIELSALDFAWNQAVKETVLENAKRTINHIEGRAECLDCNTVFAIQHYYDSCPSCGRHLINITQGKELRVKSLVVS